MAKNPLKPKVIVPQPGREVRIQLGDVLLTLKLSASGKATKAVGKKAAPAKKATPAKKAAAKRFAPAKKSPAPKTAPAKKAAAKRSALKRPAAKAG